MGHYPETQPLKLSVNYKHLRVAVIIGTNIVNYDKKIITGTGSCALFPPSSFKKDKVYVLFSQYLMFTPKTFHSRQSTKICNFYLSVLISLPRPWFVMISNNVLSGM
jgi:hypothetical protein